MIAILRMERLASVSSVRLYAIGRHYKACRHRRNPAKPTTSARCRQPADRAKPIEGVPKRLLYWSRPEAKLSQTRAGIEAHAAPRELDARYRGHGRPMSKDVGNELIRVRRRESDAVRDAPGRLRETGDLCEQGKDRTDRQVLVSEQIAPAEASPLHR